MMCSKVTTWCAQKSHHGVLRSRTMMCSKVTTWCAQKSHHDVLKSRTHVLFHAHVSGLSAATAPCVLGWFSGSMGAPMHVRASRCQAAAARSILGYIPLVDAPCALVGLFSGSTQVGMDLLQRLVSWGMAHQLTHIPHIRD
eukprot:1152087-Pelagomonas_calceolata.AAC.1